MTKPGSKVPPLLPKILYITRETDEENARIEGGTADKQIPTAAGTTVM